jgi:hypothetical protein
VVIAHMKHIRNGYRILFGNPEGERPLGISVCMWDINQYNENQHDALSIQFIKNEWPVHVLSITCSSSGGVTQTTLGILCACCISWLPQG